MPRLLFALMAIPWLGSALTESSYGAPVKSVLIKDINPQNASSNIQDSVTMNGVAYFSANDGAHGRELWRSDGTPAGTSMVKDINPGPGDGTYSHLIAAGDRLYFTANDGVHGNELWRSDGTAQGTVIVADTLPNMDSGDAASIRYVAAGPLIFFFIQHTFLWRSDGTAAGTQIEQVLADGFNFAAAGSHVVFRTSTPPTAGNCGAGTSRPTPGRRRSPGRTPSA